MIRGGWRFGVRGASKGSSLTNFVRVLCIMLCFLLISKPAKASVNDNMQNVLVIGNDRGGLLRTRLEQIEELRARNIAIEIRGRICYSTCTLFLGLEQTCVNPNTIFGFHGPSSYGRALQPSVFEQASRIIANHYPPALRQWYLQSGRYKINSIYRIRGEQMIRLGVPQCPS